MKLAHGGFLLAMAAVFPAFTQSSPKTTDTPKAAETAATPAPAAATASAPKPASTAEAMRLSIDKQREAVEKQREAARKQAEAVGTRLKPGNIPAIVDPVEADCDPLADEVIAPLVDTNARAQQVKPELLRAVMEQESGYRPCAVSGKGAQGLMQLMPATAQQFGVNDIFDPKENVAAGAKLLKQLVDKYNGDLAKALAAYNAGAAAVDQAGGIPDIQETKDYVDAILKKLGSTPAAPPSIPTPKPIGN